MPTDLPDPPRSFGDMLSPEPKRKSVAAAVISGVTLLAIGGLLVSLVLVGGTPPEKVTGNESPAALSPVEVPDFVPQKKIDRITAQLTATLDGPEAEFNRVRDEIIAKTGCTPVTGGRQVVDITDQAAVAEEKQQRGRYVHHLGSQGLQPGHVVFKSGPNEVTHQVIAWMCIGG